MEAAPVTTKENVKITFENIADILMERFPDAEKANFNEVEVEQKRLGFIDSELFDNDIVEAIRLFNIDPTKIERDQENGCYSMKIESSKLPVLPEGYAYKGGAARALLFEALGISKDEVVRDLDVVRISEEEPYEGADEYVSKTFMSEDYEFGHGVEQIVNIKAYLKSRDLTINEVLAVGDMVYVTKEALRDSIRKILRITDEERSRFEGEYRFGMPHKLMAKMVRFYAESIISHDDKNSFYIDPEQKHIIEESFIFPFYIAVHLDRAFQSGEDVAQSYLLRLRELGQIPEKIENTKELVVYINKFLSNDAFYYRNAPFDQYELEKEWLSNNYQNTDNYDDNSGRDY